MSKQVRLLEACRVIDEGYFYNSLGVAGIDFLYLNVSWVFKALDFNLLPSSLPGEMIKRKTDLVPDREISGWLSLLIDMAAFQVTEMADIVDRLITA